MTPSSQGDIVWVVTGWHDEQTWVVGVYTDEAVARRVASKPRREVSAHAIDHVPVLG